MFCFPSRFLQEAAQPPGRAVRRTENVRLLQHPHHQEEPGSRQQDSEGQEASEASQDGEQHGEETQRETQEAAAFSRGRIDGSDAGSGKVRGPSRQEEPSRRAGARSARVLQSRLHHRRHRVSGAHGQISTRPAVGAGRKVLAQSSAGAPNGASARQRVQAR